MNPPPDAPLWEGRPSFWLWWPRILIGDLSLALIVALWGIGESRWIPPAAGLCVVAYLSAAIERASVRYAVSSRRVSSSCGILSRSSIEVQLADVHSTALRQSFLERLLGIGSLGLVSGPDGSESIVLERIKDPAKAQEMIAAAKTALAPAAGALGA